MYCNVDFYEKMERIFEGTNAFVQFEGAHDDMWV